jgi:hypothetical protein
MISGFIRAVSSTVLFVRSLAVCVCVCLGLTSAGALAWPNGDTASPRDQDLSFGDTFQAQATAEKKGTVNGKVTFADGKPVPDITVVFYIPPKPVAPEPDDPLARSAQGVAMPILLGGDGPLGKRAGTTTTNPEGKYTIMLKPGTYTVHAGSSLVGFGQATVIVEAGKVVTQDVSVARKSTRR